MMRASHLASRRGAALVAAGALAVLSAGDPVAAQPAATPIATQGIPPGPIAWRTRHELLGRAAHAMAYDPRRQRVVLFGGTAYATKLGDTWEWDGTGWDLRQPRTMPRPRWGHAMAFDAVRGTVLLFGGTDDQQALGDLWEWDGQEWRQIPFASGPGGRYWHSMVWDSARQRAVLFGGITSSGVFSYTATSETWEWDGQSWTQRFPPTLPTARFGSAAAYHPASQRTVVFSGGPFGNPQPDTWVWDGQDWTELAVGAGPPPRFYGGMARDPVTGDLVLYGGASSTAHADTWVFDGGSWTQLQPASVPWPYMTPEFVADDLRRQIVMFGGLATSPSPPGFSSTQTWIWNGADWILVHAPITPTGVFKAAYVSDCDHVLLVGPGVSSPTPVQTWTLSEAGLQQIVAPAAPPNRYRHSVAYHAGSKQTVLYGGVGSGSVSLNDTWLWDGATWTEFISATVPPLFRCGGLGLVYDSARDKIVMTCSPDSLWEWDPAGGWVERKPAFRPRNFLNPLAYDPARQRVVSFGVRDAQGNDLAETWEWDGVQWHQAQPKSQPPAQRYGFMEYVGVLGGVVLIGPPETWRWDGREWEQLAIEPLPTSSGLGAWSMAYDVGRRRLLAFSTLGETIDSVRELSLRTLSASQPEPRLGESLTLDVALPSQAGLPFVLGLSGGTAPGIPLRPVPGGVELLPLRPDALLVQSLALPIAAILDPRGRASFGLRIPPDPRLLGFRVYAAGLTLAPGPSVGTITNVQALFVVP